MERAIVIQILEPSHGIVLADSQPVGVLQAVAALPECYQPVYGHPELSAQVSRTSTDRLELIRLIHDRMTKESGRPVRVLDLGCAQGYFCMNLAERGADVTGVDFLDKNVDVCKALALENRGFKTRFVEDEVEPFILSLADDEYDLVLGLSVFHHIIHARGLESTMQLMAALGEKIGSGIFEFARHDEPLYWAKSQPDNTAHLLEAFSFKTVLGTHGTHLSGIERPFFYASNRYWLVDGRMGEFHTFMTSPHSHGKLEAQGGPHKGTRHYFIGESMVLKVYDTAHPELGSANAAQLQQEAEVLENPPKGFQCARLHGYNTFPSGAYLFRDKIEGKLLSDVISSGDKSYNPNQVVMDTLEQLVQLEQQGYFFDDLRTWNVILTPDGAVRLIDYGSIGTNRFDCMWPHDLMLTMVAFCRQLFDRVVAEPCPYFLCMAPMINFGRLPPPYRDAFAALFMGPQETQTFAHLHQLIEALSNNQEKKAYITEDFFRPFAVLEDAAMEMHRHIIDGGNPVEISLPTDSYQTSTGP